MDKPRDDDRPRGSLGEALETFLRDTGLLETSREQLCALLWGEVAGQWYARFSAVTRVADGIVYVRCDSAPRANQLQLDAPEIMRRLNERLGCNFVREIRPSSAGSASVEPVSARRPELQAAPTEAELEAIELTPGECERMRAQVEDLADAGVRERVEAVLVTQAKARRWQADHGYTECEGCGGYFAGSGRFCLACRPPPRPRTTDDTPQPEWGQRSWDSAWKRSKTRRRRGRGRRG